VDLVGCLIVKALLLAGVIFGEALWEADGLGDEGEEVLISVMEGAEMTFLDDEFWR
jgi:hypothetical protein